MALFEDCILFLLGKAYQKAQGIYKTHLAPYGLTPMQFLVLEALFEEGQYTELNQAQLAERSQRLNLEVQNRVCKDQEYFGMGSEFRRLRLISRPEIIQLFKREILK